MAIGDDATVDIARFAASEIDPALARKVAVLLGRAFTDERHVRDYTPEQHAELGAAVRRVHEALPSPGELMPATYLDHFPTLRNLARPPAERRACEHFVALGDGYAATHVAMFAQHFRFGSFEAAAGYIEDVVTDPLHVGNGLASHAMRMAEARARALELDVLGLATGIVQFYERLGWREWSGGHTFQVIDFGLSYPDEPLMLMPLTGKGERLAQNAGHMLSWRLWQFGEQPPVS